MAEATSAPDAAPAPPTDTAPAAAPLTSIADLDQRMAEIRANPTPPPADDAPVQGAPSASDQPQPEPSRPADPEQGDVPEADEGSSDPAKPGGRFARLRDQLTAAEQAKRDAEQRLQDRMAQDALVADKYRGLLGSAEERQQLTAILANPNSPTYEVNQARTRLAQMNQAATELAPLRAEVERSVFEHFTRGMDALRTLDGMDEQSHQALFKAPSGVEALKLMHGIGKKAAEDEFKGTVADLKQQNADLKRQLAARGAQPATPGGLSPNGSSRLAGWLGADGLPTEEAIARAKRGGFRDLATT